MEAKEIFAANLKYYVTKSGKTQSQIASDLGVSKGTFSDWANGRSHPRMNRVQAVAEYFEITTSDLVEELNHDGPSLKALHDIACGMKKEDIELTILFAERLRKK